MSTYTNDKKQPMYVLQGYVFKKIGKMGEGKRLKTLNEVLMKDMLDCGVTER